MESEVVTQLVKGLTEALQAGQTKSNIKRPIKLSNFMVGQQRWVIPVFINDWRMLMFILDSVASQTVSKHR